MLANIQTRPTFVRSQSMMQQPSNVDFVIQIDSPPSIATVQPAHMHDPEESCGEQLPPLRIRTIFPTYLKRWRKSGELSRCWPDFKTNVIERISLTEARVFDEDDNIRRLPLILCDIFQRRDGDPKFAGLIICHHNKATRRRAKEVIESDPEIRRRWLHPVCRLSSAFPACLLINA